MAKEELIQYIGEMHPTEIIGRLAEWLEKSKTNKFHIEGNKDKFSIKRL